MRRRLLQALPLACALLAAGGLVGARGAPRPRLEHAVHSIVRRSVRSVVIAAGTSQTVRAPYPDALRYGNARYLGRHAVGRDARAHGRRPDLARVAILSAGSIEGGSYYQVRARNGNPRGTAGVRLTVTAITIEPLPHR